MKVIGMGKLRIAISTKGEKGLDDEVAEVFGRTNTITIVDIINGEVKNVQVLKNPAASFRFGAGPILVKTLIDMNVNVVVSGELGPSASELIEDHKMSKVIVKPGTPVKEAIKTVELQLS
ncbi:MAG: hypothetical protein HA496_11230 [Thaumarchaeota archaeon]|nr:hypothetical protein [Nitrososphaerota archaeon]